MVVQEKKKSEKMITIRSESFPASAIKMFENISGKHGIWGGKFTKRFKDWCSNLYINNKGIRKITEIGFLNILESLVSLSLADNQITEINGLENLVQLEFLYLDHNQITEIKGLENLVQLKFLYLGNNQITEIKGLENLTNLEKLHLNNNQITEIKGLENLENLGELHLNNNQITEIKGLENPGNLGELYLNNNQITEIKGLENFKNDFIILKIGNNPIPDALIKKLGGVDEYERVIDFNSFAKYCFQKEFKKESFERDSIEKLKKILGVSNRFRLDMMMDILNMDKKTLIDKLKNWSADFGLKINGNYLIIKKDTVLEFIDALDKQFRVWEKIEKRKMKKI